MLSKEEREKISAINLVADDWKHVNPKTWTPADVDFIRTAAEQPEVERVLVNAAIKKELCRVEDKQHDSWMDKVRPWYGHARPHPCAAEMPGRFAELPQAAAGAGRRRLRRQGSRLLVLRQGAASEAADRRRRSPPKALTLADLPPACKTVLDAPANPKAVER